MHYYFITGASGGLGRALAVQLLAAADAVVVGIARHSTIRHARYQHQFLDLADVAAVEQALPQVFLPFDDATRLTLINNAGVLGTIGYVGQLAPGHFARVFGVNALAPALLLNAFLAAYAARGLPLTVLNISSGAAQRPIDGWAAYCASKAALEMLTRTVAAEQVVLGNHHVRVCALSPGVLDTPMQAQIRAADAAEFSQVAHFQALHANGELTGADAAARRIVAFLGQPVAPAAVVINLRDVDSGLTP